MYTTVMVVVQCSGSLVEEKNFNHLINKHPQLIEERDSYILHKSGDKLFLPRFFYKNFPSKVIQCYDPPYEPEKINLEFQGEPRENQLPLLNKVFSIYEQTGSLNGIIKCFCGFGKTACSIYIATKLGFKTLFVVDKDSLYKQWIQEIVKFTNISPEDIGIIKKNIFRVENKPFVIATVQTILSKVKKEPKEIYEKMKKAGFGLVVYDECHNTSASEQYARSSVVMPSPNILGLSATPFKNGAQDILMKNVIGDILHSESNYKSVPKIIFHHYKSGLDKYKGIMSRLGFVEGKAFYNKIILNSPDYLKKITRFVKEDLKENHRIMVLCWTEKQLQAVSESLLAAGIEHRQFYGKKRTFERTDKVLVVT